ncbi:hypothetical protein DSO57_1021160 [Entomophthora muscae]|uniref:Uncharacterized protein n=1 Tax=Entomophthora muscae TaxID=34485 RepID=A0ACC2TQM2_9FUNG|nr:hypothetical protein DSO57_1021160 [Entomophthora muscae]
MRQFIGKEIIVKFGKPELLVTDGGEKLNAINAIIYLADVATKFPDSPANVSHNAQGAFDELSLDISNNMNRSDGNVKLWALSAN